MLLPMLERVEAVADVTHVVVVSEIGGTLKQKNPWHPRNLRRKLPEKTKGLLPST